MEDAEKNPQAVSWWITSLAISVTCCAVLFVIFAGYLNDIKKQLSNESAQLEQMAIHEDKLLSELISMQRTLMTAQQPQAAPATVLTPPPITVEPPVATTPVGTAAPVEMAPAPVAPSVLPEVPAKK